MSDEIDNLLRRAMSTLDREVPDGYFDALPDRTLARLDAPREIDQLDGLDGLDGLDDLARERAARARAQPGASREPEPAPVAVTPQDPPAPSGRDAGTARRRPRRALVAALGVGLAAAVVVLWISSQARMAMSPPSSLQRPALEPRGLRTKETAMQPVPQIGTRDSPAPTAEDFVAAISAVATRTRTCVPGVRTAKVVLEVTVRSSGEIAQAHLLPPFAGTALEACIRRVVGVLRFPSWTGPSQTFRYPFPADDAGGSP
jgi:hypothetical protein